MNDRIRKLRKSLDLTQTEFAKRIGMTQNTLTGYERGKINPSNPVVNNICKTFNVNEIWLRTGEGEMFVQTEDSAIERLCSDMNASKTDVEILRLYFKIDPKIREQFVQQLFHIVQTEYLISETPTQQLSSSTLTPEQQARAEAEKYYQELLDEKKAAAESAALRNIESKSKLA